MTTYTHTGTHSTEHTLLQVCIGICALVLCVFALLNVVTVTTLGFFLGTVLFGDSVGAVLVWFIAALGSILLLTIGGY